MKVFFDMVGCRLNQAEIDMLAIDLARKGATVVSKAEQADTIIINTCCVTKKACADSRKMIRHYRENTQADVISTGCWVNVDFDEARKISDLAVRNAEKENIPISLTEKITQASRQIGDKPHLGKRSRTRGFVKVQDGCNNACSFCLTTIARGASNSKTIRDVLFRINELNKMGVKEVVLTGVQLGSWGKELKPAQRFSDLIEAILADSDIPRVRFSSIEPWDLDIDLIRLLNHPRICAHLHIPLQSGSDVILRSMRRPTTTSRFQQLLELIRTEAPQTNLTTDVISGFPGETDAVFQESFDFIESCSLDGGHVFSFSPMPGTEAADLTDQVHEGLIKMRTRKLMDHFAAQAHKAKQAMIGQVVQVLVEKGRQNDQQTVWSGFAENYVKVNLPSPLRLDNRIVEVLVKRIDGRGNLHGEAVNLDPSLS